MRDGVIQRFEYTNELTHKALRRFLEETEPAPDEIREMSFPALIRLGSQGAVTPAVDVEPEWPSLVLDILREHAPRPCRVYALDESDLPWRVDLAACSPTFRQVVESQAVFLLEIGHAPA